MKEVLREVSDRLSDSIAKSEAIADVLRIVDAQNFNRDTLSNLGWLLSDEIMRMEEQVDRLNQLRILINQGVVI